MVKVTVSSKFQVVIPKKIRDKLGIKPGQKVQVIPYSGRIEMIHIREIIEESRGFLAGIDTTIKRDVDR